MNLIWSALVNAYTGSNLAEICDGLIDTGLSRIPPLEEMKIKPLSFQGSVSAHINLLQCGRAVIRKLSEDGRVQAAAAPILHHDDLHKQNIFVSDDDPTVVTDIIDWQSSSIKPALEYADNIPDFAGNHDESAEDQKREKLRAELCQKAYDAGIRILIPSIGAARSLDTDLVRPFRYCHRTWRDSIPAFRQDLIILSARWKDLGLPDQCPYVLPAPDELAHHQEQYEDFKLAHYLKGQISSLLDASSKGWIPNNMWPTIHAWHKEVFEGFLAAVREVEGTEEGEQMTEEKLRMMWPFDIP